jgi:hypothetical protein
VSEGRAVWQEAPAYSWPQCPPFWEFTFYDLDQWRFWMTDYPGPAMWLARMCGYSGA